MRSFTTYILLAGIGSLFPVMLAYAAMSSSHYTIQSDSINFAGGNSTSTNYTLESTAGEVGSGDSSSANYNLHAGYQQMQENYIAIAVASTTSLGSISGLGGGTALGSSTINVITDSPSGYSLTVKANTSPALQGPGGASFADYAPASPPTPDYTFSITSSQAAFGYSPEGSDIVEAFKDNGSACNTGSGDTPERCWDGFSTTAATIAQSGARTSPSGTNTVLEYEAKIGSNVIKDAGAYSASITITAVSL